MNAYLAYAGKGYKIDEKPIEGLYSRVMGLRAIMPENYISRRNKEHKVSPYLLWDITVDRPN